jgi:hypothetical protein
MQLVPITYIMVVSYIGEALKETGVPGENH